MMILRQHACLVLTGMLVFLCLSVTTAHAQSTEVAPAPFATPPSDDMIQPIETGKQNDAEKPAAPSDTDKKMVPAKQALGYFKTYLVLQRQNALLEKLLDREETMLKTAESYQKIGFPYEPTKPALSLCREIPVNMSCALAYPDRYAGFIPLEPAPVVLPPAIDTKSIAAAVDPAGVPQDIGELSPETAIRELLWTDITCLQSVCRAVLTPDPADAKARYAVTVGDPLPPGGIVQSISSNGVIIVLGKETISLLPAPTRPFGLGKKTF